MILKPTDDLMIECSRKCFRDLFSSSDLDLDLQPLRDSGISQIDVEVGEDGQDDTSSMKSS